MALKDDWKETGKDLGHAFKNLGKTLIRSASKGIEAAEKWAREEDKEHTEDKKESASNETENNGWVEKQKKFPENLGFRGYFYPRVPISERAFLFAFFPFTVGEFITSAVILDDIEAAPGNQSVKALRVQILQGMAKLMKQIEHLLILRLRLEHLFVDEQRIDSWIKRTVGRFISLRHVEGKVDR